MKNLEKWTQALTLLFEACEPLTFDDDLTKEQLEARNSNIERYTFYCVHVKGAIEDGVEPLNWDEWSDREQSFMVEDLQQFANDLTQMFEVPKKSFMVEDLQQFANDLTQMFEVPKKD